jgi:spermidine/putrescine transport system substrate-binding protein
MRRWFGLSILVGVLACLLALAGCSSKKEDKPGPAQEPPKPATPTELNLLIFSEYIDEKIVSDFEKLAGVRLRITTYESTEEMEGKLSYGGADSQYDVVVAASQTLARLARKDLIRPLDHAKIPNLKNLDARFSGAAFDDGNKYGVPYQWGTVGIMYDKKKLPSLEPSWSVMLDAKRPAGTFVLLDEMRDMLGVVLKYKGHSSNSTVPDEIREAGRILQDAKASSKCLGFKGGVGAVQDVKAGSADMAVVWNGYAVKEVAEDKERFAYMIPKEGSVMWVDAMMITRRAPSPELAHKFVDFILDPEIGGRLSAFTRYATPNAAAKSHVSAEDQANLVIYPNDETMGRLEYHRDLADTIKLFDETWTAVKSR